MEQPATAQPSSNEVAPTIEMFRPKMQAQPIVFGPMMSVIAASDGASLQA
jgi:hypothetical protein